MGQTDTACDLDLDPLTLIYEPDLDILMITCLVLVTSVWYVYCVCLNNIRVYL